MTLSDKINVENKKSLVSLLRDLEGVRRQIYLDSRGIPSFGVGSALGKINESNVVTMYDRSEVNSRLMKAGFSELSPDDYKKLQNMVSLSNVSPPKEKSPRQKELERLLVENKDSIGQTGSEDGINLLLNEDIDRILPKIDATILVEFNQIKNLPDNVTIKTLYDKITNNKFVALASFGFNNPGKLLGTEADTASKIVTALATGDNWGVYVEILTGSNKIPSDDKGNPVLEGIAGLQNRRFREAELFSPFSGAGGEPANVAELSSVLSNYTPDVSLSFMKYFKAHQVTLRKAGDTKFPPCDLELNVRSFIPYQVINNYLEKEQSSGRLTEEQALDLRRSLSVAARNLEAAARTVYNDPSFSIKSVVDPDDTIQFKTPVTGT